MPQKTISLNVAVANRLDAVNLQLIDTKGKDFKSLSATVNELITFWVANHDKDGNSIIPVITTMQGENL